MPPNIVARISHFSGSSVESTYLVIFRLYSFSCTVSFETNTEYLSISVLYFTVSTIFLISEALSLLFFPDFSKPLDASMIRMSELGLFFFKTIMIVAILVPKNMFSGNPIIASIRFFSIRFSRIFASSPPRKSTP